MSATRGPRSAGRTAALYVLPAVAAAVLTVYGPMLAVTALSLFDFNLTTRPPDFVGLANHVEQLTAPEWHRAWGVTALYAVLLLPLSVVAPCATAIVVWLRGGRLTPLYRALCFLPVLIPPAVAALLWQWLLNPLLGLANWPLEVVGLPPVQWLTQPATALIAVAVVTGWKVFGLAFILFTAGLVQIDADVLDAARVDRAGERQVVRHIVVPLLRPTVVVVVFATVVLAGPWTFGVIDVLTGGGPAAATTHIFYLLYRQAFSFADGGAAAATSVLVTVVFAVVVLMQLRVAREAA